MEPIPTTGNRPALPRINYRIRTYSQFREQMLERLSARGTDGLRALGTRDDSDYSIALLDLFAYVGDVLTFYQERTANEAFLGTARQPESLRRLAAMLDYHPAPGAGALTHLAFTLATPTTALPQTRLEAGLRMASLPGQDVGPQKFSTTESRITRAGLNQLVPVSTREQSWNRESTRVLLRAPSRQPGPGERLLLLGIEPVSAWAWASGTIAAVHSRTIVDAAGAPETVIELELANGLENVAELDATAVPGPRAFVLRRTASLFGSRAPTFTALPEAMRWQYSGTPVSVRTTSKLTPGADGSQSLTMSTELLDPDGKVITGPAPTEWVFGGTPGAPDQLDLDAEYRDLVPGSVVLIEERPGVAKNSRVFTVRSTAVVARDDYLLSGKVTRLTLADLSGAATDLGLYRQTPRTSLVSWDGAEQPLATAPIGGSFGRGSITVQGDFTTLERGRPLVLIGTAAGSPTGEAALLASAEADGGSGGASGINTVLNFDPPLVNAYERAGLRVFANVLPATRGEGTVEVLGHGNAAQAFASFTLKKSPLTYLPHPGSPHGLAPALEIRVDGVLWNWVPSLFGHGPNEPVYTITRDSASVSSIGFGDGITGRRLPTGHSNITATYQYGAGAAGNVAANTITTALDRPPGLKAVTNPLAASGGTDPEDPALLRHNAPNTVRTFGRIVSLLDFEDAARQYAGIAKARAVIAFDGETTWVRLCVAGEHAAVIAPGSAIHGALLADLDARRDPNRALVLQEHEPLPLDLSATLRIDVPTHDPVLVMAAVRAAVGTFFAFESRELGIPLRLAELYPVFHAVPGVVAVDIDVFAPHTQTSAALIPTIFPAPNQLPVLADPALTALHPVPRFEGQES